MSIDPPADSTAPGTLSPDGAWRWDGARWMPNLGGHEGTGAGALTPEPPASPATGRPRAARRLVSIGIAVLLVAAGAAALLLLRGGGAGQELNVVIGDFAAGDGDCSPGGYTGSRFVGTRLTLRDSRGQTLDSAALSGSGKLVDTNEPARGPTEGCAWTLSLAGLGDSAVYELEIEPPDRAPETLTLSEKELEEQDYSIELFVNR